MLDVLEQRITRKNKITPGVQTWVFFYGCYSVSLNNKHLKGKIKKYRKISFCYEKGEKSEDGPP
jgi:hypothetical protein